MVINIKHSKCLGAEKCGICLKVCPQGVFMNVPEGEYVYKKNPESRKIIPSFKELCNKCKLCVYNCPKKCIIIK